MGSHLEDRDGAVGRLERPRPRALLLHPSFGPIAALTITTVALLSSAIRVVASSIASLGSPPIQSQMFEPKSPASVFTRPAELPTDPPLRLASALPCPADLPATSTPKTVPVNGLTSDKPPVASAPKAAKPAATTAGSGSKTGTAAPEPLPARPQSDARRIMVRDRSGRPMVTRVHGGDGDHVAVLLPDGSIGWPDGLTYTEKPFVLASKAEIKEALLRELRDFQTIETKHYIVAYQGSRAFAQNSATLLENLYANLSSVLNRRGVPVHEAEFPLVAVIFRTEDEFRRHKRVAPDVQAYYEILSNRIFLYETSRRDLTAPEVSALQKPQTVAHEGTHQILQNIGVHPRLANWPIWLVEGLAEYCATPTINKKGAAVWDGLGKPNLLHIATMRDLDDPLSTMVRGAGTPRIQRDLSKTLVEYLVTRTELNPTDYALSWALTYHLARFRSDEFLDFVREMSAIKPLEKRSPEDHLHAFKNAFGENLAKVETGVSNSLRKLKQIDSLSLPYYAVMFEQQIGGTIIRRAMVSQSPSMIRQWIDNSTAPAGGEPRWQVFTHPTRARALLNIDQWVTGG